MTLRCSAVSKQSMTLCEEIGIFFCSFDFFLRKELLSIIVCMYRVCVNIFNLKNAL